jgi:eukaryotic-like serine/threonine-protein kinase
MTAPVAPAPRHILLAEDDETNRQLLELYLGKRGYAVTSVANGLEALEALDEARARHIAYDIVLLDWMMPVLTGFEALRRLRREEPDIPVIMLTAVAGSQDIVGALELGADDYVTKPYELPVLVARIEARLRRRATPEGPAGTDEAKDAGAMDEGARVGGGAPAPGMIIDDRYELLEQIGAGSFGVVYRARHTTLEADVAVKILRTVTGSGSTELLAPVDSEGQPQGRVRSSEGAEDFRKEGVRACRVQHENAVRVYDFGVLPLGLAYLVMELLRGRTLEDELKEKQRLSVERAVEVLAPVCACLAAAHDAHLVHRDIKPANIFLHDAHHGGARGEVVKVLDFGVAKLLDAGAAATRDAIAGSPAYMAPERLRGRGYDGRSDVYAVGITLFELLTGRVPFRSDNRDPMAVALMQLREAAPPVSTFVPALSTEVDAVVAALLEKEPGRRPTARQALARLQELRGSLAG